MPDVLVNTTIEDIQIGKDERLSYNELSKSVINSKEANSQYFYEIKAAQTLKDVICNLSIATL